MSDFVKRHIKTSVLCLNFHPSFFAPSPKGFYQISFHLLQNAIYIISSIAISIGISDVILHVSVTVIFSDLNIKLFCDGLAHLNEFKNSYE